MKGEKLERYLSAKQAAEMLGVHKQTIFRWVKEKKLNPIKVGERAIRYKLSEIEDYIRSLNECKD